MALNKIKFIPSPEDPYDGGGPSGAIFTAEINPETIKHSRAVKVNAENVSNTAYDVFQFKGYGKETVGMQLIFDGTGYANKSGTSVTSQISKLLTCVYKYQSSSHKCNYVLISYGPAFSEKWWNIESLDINYTL